MIHPMIVHNSGSVLTIYGDKLEKLLIKPKPILWVREGEYRWVPIEAVCKYVAEVRQTYLHAVEFMFTIEDTVAIPKEAGDVIVKYNGHDD